MPRAPKLTTEQVRAAADRAEGIRPDEAQYRKPLGRPPGYKPEYATKAALLCEHGFTEKELADFLDVSTATITIWKGKYPDFLAALKTGKSASDERVERSLYNRAVGYSFESEKVFQFQGEIVRAKTVEHVAPDTTACIFWLKNRRRNEWRDVHKHEHGQVGDFDRMRPEQLRDFILREAEALGVSGPVIEVEGSGDPSLPTVPGHGTA